MRILNRKNRNRFGLRHQPAKVAHVIGAILLVTCVTITSSAGINITRDAGGSRSSFDNGNLTAIEGSHIVLPTDASMTIDGPAQLATYPYITGGLGTSVSPYIISGYEITATFPITLRNLIDENMYLVIDDCLLHYLVLRYFGFSTIVVIKFRKPFISSIFPRLMKNRG